MAKLRSDVQGNVSAQSNVEARSPPLLHLANPEEGNSESDSDSDAPVEEATNLAAPIQSRAEAAVQAQKERRARAQRARAEAKKERNQSKRVAKQSAAHHQGQAPEPESDSGSDDQDLDQPEDEESENANLDQDESDEDDSDEGSDDDDDADDDDDEESEEEDEEETGGTRLDPELFKQAFARQAALYEQETGSSSQTPSVSTTSAPTTGQKRKTPPTKEAPEDKMARLKEAVAAKQRARDAKAGIVRGFDNQPMRRLEDGRTVVRSLGKKHGTQSGNEGLAIDTGAGDERASRKNPRARAFVKKHLSERGGVMETSSLADHQAPLHEGKSRKKPKKTVDDPLGLEDPEFMPGGTLASRDGGKKMFGSMPRGPRAKPSTNFRGREAGGRIAASAAALQSGVGRFRRT